MTAKRPKDIPVLDERVMAGLRLLAASSERAGFPDIEPEEEPDVAAALAWLAASRGR